jgi:pilus assembly protein Flp/PilA
MIDYLNTWLHLRADRRAVTAVEYGLIAALIVIVIIGSINHMGVMRDSVFNNIANAVAGAVH